MRSDDQRKDWERKLEVVYRLHLGRLLHGKCNLILSKRTLGSLSRGLGREVKMKITTSDMDTRRHMHWGTKRDKTGQNGTSLTETQHQLEVTLTLGDGVVDHGQGNLYLLLASVDCDLSLLVPDSVVSSNFYLCSTHPPEMSEFVNCLLPLDPILKQ